MVERNTSQDDEADALVRVLTEQPHVELREVLPTLQALGGEWITSGHLDTRARTTLSRMKCSTWSELAKTSADQMRSVPNSGQLTVARILTAAAKRHLSAATGQAPHISATTSEPDHEASPRDQSRELHRLRDLFRQISEWAVRERHAMSLGDIITLSPDLGRVPPELLRQFKHQSEEPIGTFVGSPNPDLPPTLINDLFDAPEARFDVLVRRKISRGPAPTLQDLGSQMGVTRERIRQLESKASKVLEERLHDPLFAPLRWRASDLADVLGPAVPESSPELRDGLAWAARDLDESGHVSTEDLLLWIAGPYERDGDWLIKEGEALDHLLGELDAQLDRSLVIGEDEVRDALERVGLGQPVLDPIMELLEAWRRISDDAWVRWSGAVGDKAAVVMELAGEPCSAETINQFIGEGHSERSVRGAMASDERFVRVDKAGTFALAAWGLEEYSGIANEILERIERAGGAVRLDGLIDEFVSEFGVSENSVRMYAGAPAFVTNDGWVRLRRDDEPFGIDRRIDRVRGLYVLADGQVVVHDIVDRDVRRGSGRAFPEAAAASLGVVPGGRATFESDDLGNLVVSWPRTATTGPSIGSTRQVARFLNLDDGDPFRLVLDGSSRRFTADTVDSSSIQGLSGVRVEPGHELEGLAVALGTEPSAVRAVLQARREHELLSLLPEYHGGDDLGEAISDFGSLLEP